MIKRIALLTAMLAVLTVGAASALDFQQKQWYGQGILALPMGDFGDVANLGFGAGVGLTVPHSPELSFSAEFSYIYFTTEDFGEGYDVSASLMPLNVLANYHLENSQFYLVGGLGLVFAKASVEWDDPVWGSGDDSDTSTEFGLILGGGYALSPKVDLGARFNLISDANNLSAHVLYKF